MFCNYQWVGPLLISLLMMILQVKTAVGCLPLQYGLESRVGLGFPLTMNGPGLGSSMMRYQSIIASFAFTYTRAAWTAYTMVRSGRRWQQLVDQWGQHP